MRATYLFLHRLIIGIMLTFSMGAFACEGLEFGPDARCFSFDYASNEVDIDQIRDEMRGQSAPVTDFSEAMDSSFEEMESEAVLLNEVCDDRGGRVYVENGERTIYCSGQRLGPVEDEGPEQNTEQSAADVEPDDAEEEAVEAEQEESGARASSEGAQQCDERLKTLMDEFLSDKSRNIVGKQFHLTNLKLSQMVLDAKKDNPYIETLEDMAQAKSRELQESDPDGMLRAKMVHFYRMSESGRSQDQQIANTYRDKISQSKYWHPETRLFNNHTSAFAFAYSQSEETNGQQPGLNELDAASLWLMDKVQRAGEENGLTGGQSNLLNSSTQVAFMTGAVEDDHLNKSEEEIQDSIRQTQSEISETLAGFSSEVEENLQHCLDEEGRYLGAEGTCLEVPQLVKQSYLNNVMDVANRINREDIEIDGKEVELDEEGSSFRFALE